MQKVLFVCLGNICRSPLAEAIFMKKVQDKGLSDQFVAASCGTANYHVGDPPDPRTIKNALSNNTTINHVGRQLHHTDFEEFNYILAMDEKNISAIRKQPNAHLYSDKIQLMRAYDPQQSGQAVPDPYYGTEKDFQEVFDILDRSIDQFLMELINAKNLTDTVQ